MRRAISCVRKNGAAQIDAHHLVVAFRRHVKDVAALAHRNAGIVDEAIEAAEGGECFFGERRRWFSDPAILPCR